MKKRLGILVLSLMFAVMMVACGGAKTEEASEEESIGTVSVELYYPSGEIETLEFKYDSVNSEGFNYNRNQILRIGEGYMIWNENSKSIHLLPTNKGAKTFFGTYKITVD